MELIIKPGRRTSVGPPVWVFHWLAEAYYRYADPLDSRIRCSRRTTRLLFRWRGERRFLVTDYSYLWEDSHEDYMSGYRDWRDRRRDEAIASYIALNVKRVQISIKLLKNSGFLREMSGKFYVPRRYAPIAKRLFR